MADKKLPTATISAVLPPGVMPEQDSLYKTTPLPPISDTEKTPAITATQPTSPTTEGTTKDDGRPILDVAQQANNPEGYALLEKVRAAKASGDKAALRQAQSDYDAHTSLGLAMASVGGGEPHAPTFYSNTAKLIKEKLPQSATAEQVRSIVGSGKAEEAKWLNVEGFLKDKPKVDRDQLLAHIDQNMPAVKRLTKGAGGDYEVELDKLKDAHERGQLSFEAYQNAKTDLEQKVNGAPTKFQQYSLPNGENYQEHLYQLKDKKPEANEFLRKTRQDIAQEQFQRDYYDLDADKMQSIEDQIEKATKEAGPDKTYKSGHWDEPNVLAHTRTTERTDAKGNKTLFLEEIQSDWHQAGRKKGYKTGQAPQEPKPLTEDQLTVEETPHMWVIKDPEGNQTHVGKGVEETKEGALDYGARYLNGVRKDQHRLAERDFNKGVPDAPFKKSWHEYVAKDMLRKAAEEGHSHIGWTTGEQQAARYDLTKQVEEIHYKDIGGGKFKIEAHSPESFNEHGELSDEVDPIHKGVYDENGLEELVGKDIAKKIIENAAKRKAQGRDWGSISGDDLKMGGEGMKGFYDKILPDYFNKLGKQYGAKVEKTHIPAGEAKATNAVVVKEGNVFHVVEKEGGGALIDTDFPTKEAAQAAADRHTNNDHVEVHSFKIPDALRQKLLKEGMPMFADGGMIGDHGEVLPGVQTFADGGIAEHVGDTSQLVNVQDPDTLEIGSIHKSQLQDALGQGFTQPPQEQVNKYIDQKMYGTPGQQAATAAEGAASAATFGLSTGVERALGVDPEGINKRAETNPWSHAGGQMAGLVGGAIAAGLTGGALPSAAGAMEVAGQTAVRGLGIAGESAVAKIGSEAVKNAVAGAMIQGGDEVGKMLASDPHQSAQTAVANVGLAGILGGVMGAGIGAASPLWHATSKGKLGTTLTALQDHLNGTGHIVPADVHATIAESGLEMTPEMTAAVSGIPEATGMVNKLQRGATHHAQSYQAQESALRNQAGIKAVEALGRTPEQVAALSEISEADVGQRIKKRLITELKLTTDPLAAQFEKVQAKYAQTPVTVEQQGIIAQQIAEMASNSGYNVSPSSPQAKELARVLSELPGLKTLEDIRKYGSVIGENTNDPTMWHLGGALKKIFRGAENEAIENALEGSIKIAGEEDMVALHRAARAAYSSAMDTIDNLNSRLHVGKYAGPKTFYKALEEMDAETVLRRLNPKGHVELLNEIGQFPGVIKELKEYHIDQLLKNAAGKATYPGQVINTKTLFSNMESMGKDMRTFLMSPEAQGKLSAIEQLINRIPKEANSGTPKGLDSIWSHMPAAAMAMVAAMEGHSPITGAILGHVMKLVGRDAPDAVRMAILKFLGTDAHPNAEGFHAMVNTLHDVIQGETKLNKAVKHVFSASEKAAPASLVASISEKAKLDKILKSLQLDQSPLMGVAAGAHAYYMPDHNAALAMTIAQAVNYLNSQRPVQQRMSPLDSMPASVNPMDKAKYDRVLGLAQAPMSVITRIKDGTLMASDVSAIKILYPDLYSRISQKLMGELVDKTARQEVIPYKTRLGLSAFLGQPLDSTMTASGISMAQPAPQGQGGQPAGPAPKKTNAPLTKMSSAAMTPAQATEQHRQSR